MQCATEAALAHDSGCQSEFLEGIAFAPDEQVTVLGDYADDAHIALLRGSGGSDAAVTVVVDFDPRVAGELWYHQHVRECGRLRRRGFTVISIIPTIAYLFRYQRGVWWLIEVRARVRLRVSVHACGCNALGFNLALARPRSPSLTLAHAMMWAQAHVGLPALTATRWGRRLIDDKAAAAASAGRTTRVEQIAAGVAAGVISGRESAREASELGELSRADMARCFVTQGFIVRANGIARMIDAIDRELGIWPLWVCGARTQLRRECHGQAAWRARFPDAAELTLFDVGAYGEPMAPGFRSVSSIRALQRVCEMPSVWGMTYMRDDEVATLMDFEGAQALRSRYAAVGAFLSLLDKVRVKALPDDLPKVSCWRLKRARLYSPAVAAARFAAAALALVVVMAAIAVAGGWWAPLAVVKR